MTWWVLTLEHPFVGVNAESDPEAATFLQVLLMNLYGVNVRLCSDRIEMEDESIQEVSGRCGTDEMGYLWTSYHYLGDPSEVRIAILTYGLPDLELQWSYTLLKSGYAYRFCHERLRVFFQSEIVQQQFVTLWKQVFNFEPNFQTEEK